ncbi:hypothetical protein AB0D66_19725 [Streptomyces sp. NPDC048270]|uniref:hypothetical protein n=1 Tax=Streptomyces sp. NPDC048270 TaxID=3154615 RepID=UPI0033D37705
MISEPELDGEWGPERPAETVEPGAGDRPLRRPPVRSWLWALGGAVLASAVWAGALAVQDRFGTDGPPIAYRHVEDLCTQVRLPALGAMSGEFEAGPERRGESPALDWSYCQYTTPRTKGRAAYLAEVRVELHKKSDPEPEFGQGPVLSPFMDVETVRPEKVPGLGEQALVSGLVRSPQIQVLDGGAVFTLNAQWWGENADEEIDSDALRAAMIEDMRDLMDRLRK